MSPWQNHWLTVWMAQWLTAQWHTDSLTHWLTDTLICCTDSLTHYELIGWLTHRMTHWLTDLQTNRLTDSLIYGSQTGSLNHWLTYWLIYVVAALYEQLFHFIEMHCNLGVLLLLIRTHEPVNFVSRQLLWIYAACHLHVRKIYFF
jgi:hypothetical protein